LSLTHDTALTDQVIGLAIDVHRHLGPGLLESAYEQCLCYELQQHNVPFSRQVALPVIYKTMQLDCAYRMDLVINRQLVVEIKSVERLMPIHESQMLTYLKLSGHSVGLLMNFNAVVLKDGLRRIVL
jgi:GxxExxY protein